MRPRAKCERHQLTGFILNEERAIAGASQWIAAGDDESVGCESRRVGLDLFGGKHRSHTVARRAQAIGHGRQHLIADLMAETIVDHLEVVEVKEHHGDRGAASIGRGQRFAEALHEQRAIWKIGDDVAVG